MGELTRLVLSSNPVLAKHLFGPGYVFCTQHHIPAFRCSQVIVIKNNLELRGVFWNDFIEHVRCRLVPPFLDNLLILGSDE